MKKIIKIEGMKCSHCAGHIKKELEQIEGVTNVQISLENKTATIETLKEVPDSELIEAVKKAGYMVKIK